MLLYTILNAHLDATHRALDLTIERSPEGSTDYANARVQSAIDADVAAADVAYFYLEQIATYPELGYQTYCQNAGKHGAE